MSQNGKEVETSRKENIKWTEEMDIAFIDAMLEQQTRGFRIDGTFKSAAYKNMQAIIEQQLGIILTKDHLKNRIKTLKNTFSTCHELLKNKSGINWNSETKMFQAEDQVWEDLIKANPNFKRWRVTPVSNYDKLGDLFSKDRATGNISGTCGEFSQIWEKESEDPNKHLAVDLHNIGDGNNDESSSHGMPTDKSTMGDSTSSKSCKRKKNSAELPETYETREHTNQQLSKLVSCLKHLVQQQDHENEEKEKEKKEMKEKEKAKEKKKKIMEEKEKAKEKEKKMEKFREVQKIYEELQRIGVPNHRLVCAYVILGSNEEKSTLFFAAPECAHLAVLNELLEMDDK